MIILSKSRQYQPYESTLPGIGHRKKLPTGQYSIQALVIPLILNEPPLFCKVHELDSNGVFFISQRQIPMHAMVRIRIKTLWGSLRLTGKVIYSIVGVGFGCEFNALNRRQEYLLTALIGLQNSAPPSARTLHLRILNS